MGIGSQLNSLVQPQQQQQQQPQGAPQSAFPQQMGGKGGAMRRAIRSDQQKPMQQMPSQGAFPRFDPSLVFPQQPTQQPPQQMGGKGGFAGRPFNQSNINRQMPVDRTQVPQQIGGKGGGVQEPGVLRPMQSSGAPQPDPSLIFPQQQAPVSSYQDQNALQGLAALAQRQGMM